MIEGEHSRGKQPEERLDRLTKWLKVERVTETLEATKGRDAWKVMIAYAKEHLTDWWP